MDRFPRFLPELSEYVAFTHHVSVSMVLGENIERKGERNEGGNNHCVRVPCHCYRRSSGNSNLFPLSGLVPVPGQPGLQRNEAVGCRPEMACTIASRGTPPFFSPHNLKNLSILINKPLSYHYLPSY